VIAANRTFVSRTKRIAATSDPIVSRSSERGPCLPRSAAVSPTKTIASVNVPT
jgi:hypothetical protein